jgi:arabinose operon protein AraL
MPQQNEWPRPTGYYDAYVFDLDGTVYLGDALLPSAGETIAALRRLGRRTVFLSNNPTHTRDEYAAKLTRLGLPTERADIVNSTLVMVDFLRKTYPPQWLAHAGRAPRLFVVGEEPLMAALRQAGFELAEDACSVDAVIASFDRTFVYRKLQVAFDAVRAGARFFATNGDRYCPVPGGGEPDAAAIIAAIEACTNTRVETVVGKPSRHMIDAVLGLLQLPAERCIMTGDRLETDVAMGLASGMASALTLTGATPASALSSSSIRPTYVVRQLSELIPAE